MTAELVEVFYAYASDDEALRDRLNEHLAHLQRQGCISVWHERKILPGSV